jgi:hypothetical protein
MPLRAWELRFVYLVVQFKEDGSGDCARRGTARRPLAQAMTLTLRAHLILEGLTLRRPLEQIMVFTLRANLNLKGLTVEELVSRRKTLYLAMVKNLHEVVSLQAADVSRRQRQHPPQLLFKAQCPRSRARGKMVSSIGRSLLKGAGARGLLV